MYICSLTLMRLIHSFNNIILTYSAIGNLEIGSVVIMLCSGCRLLCELELIEVGIR